MRKATPNIAKSSDPLAVDRQMFSTHVYEPQAPLDIPILAMHGDSESIEMLQGKRETTGAFQSKPAAGDHFWLRSSEPLLGAELRSLAGVDRIA